MQAKPTTSALILGGVDCGMTVLLVILFAVFQSSAIPSAYTFQITYLLEWGSNVITLLCLWNLHERNSKVYTEI